MCAEAETRDCLRRIRRIPEAGCSCAIALTGCYSYWLYRKCSYLVRLASNPENVFSLRFRISNRKLTFIDCSSHNTRGTTLQQRAIVCPRHHGMPGASVEKMGFDTSRERKFKGFNNGGGQIKRENPHSTVSSARAGHVAASWPLSEQPLLKGRSLPTHLRSRISLLRAPCLPPLARM